MGKKIIGVIAFAAIAVAAGWNYQQNTNEVQLSDLALENAEALARGESGTDYCDDFTTMRVVNIVKDFVTIGQVHIVFWKHPLHIFIVWRNFLNKKYYTKIRRCI